MEYDTHLYMILHPHNALVASQLDPAHFARHYTTGSSRHYRGKVIFAEIDPEFRNPFLRIDEILKVVRPHEDGRPKATKFVASYRVLEHAEFDAIGKIYLTSQEGDCIGLESGPYDETGSDSSLNLYAEITPLRMLVLSEFDFTGFGRYITDPRNPKSAPKQFYTQLELNVPEFISELESNPFKPSPIHDLHPSTLRDGYLEIATYPEKHHKGVSLDCRLDQISYKLIKNGFMFSSQDAVKFYPMPSSDTIEKQAYKFWRSM